MSMRIAPHLRANAVGYVAIFLALGSTALATNGSLPGRNKVGSADIINRELKAKDLAKGVVTPAKLRTGAVTSRKIRDGEVGESDLAEEAVTPAKLRTDAVTSGKIRDGEVGESDLAEGVVGTGELADGAVQARHLSGGVFSSGDIELQGPAGIERWGIVSGGIGARELGVVAAVITGVVIPANTAGDGQYRIREITAACREGTQIISAGADWDPEVGAEDEMFISQIDIDPGASSVEVTGGHDLAVDKILVAKAYCIQ